MAALLVDEVGAADADPRPGRRRGRGCEQRGRDGGEQREAGTPPGRAQRTRPPGKPAQAGTFSAARTRRENVIAPSSSDP